MFRASEQRVPPDIPPGYWRRHAYTRKTDATREALQGGRSAGQRTAREGQVRLCGVAAGP
jgi:hypothetical protein